MLLQPLSIWKSGFQTFPATSVTSSAVVAPTAASAPPANISTCAVAATAADASASADETLARSTSIQSSRISDASVQHTLTTTTSDASHNIDLDRFSNNSVSTNTPFGVIAPSLAEVVVIRGLIQPSNIQDLRYPPDAVTSIQHVTIFPAPSQMSVNSNFCSDKGVVCENVGTSSTRSDPMLHGQSPDHLDRSGTATNLARVLEDRPFKLSREPAGHSAAVLTSDVPGPIQEQPAFVHPSTPQRFWWIMLMLLTVHIGVLTCKAYVSEVPQWALVCVDSVVMCGVAVAMVRWCRW